MHPSGRNGATSIMIFDRFICEYDLLILEEKGIKVSYSNDAEGFHYEQLIATGTHLVFIKEDKWSFTASSETYELMFSALTSAAEMIEENNWKVEDLPVHLKPVFNAYKILDKFFNQ
jgi:hypothetical protein